ncbi:MAG TPA: helix-turn-helix domain-containing protein [Clostridia bacterium]|nr:helix-turn-helix domain-containing protein [Clostridia bacterium]
MKEKFGIDNKAIGQRIRIERENLNLTREEFSELVGLSEYYVGQLERGDRQMSLMAAVKIANCLHLSLDYLIFGKKYCSSQPDKSIYLAHDPDTSYLIDKENAEIKALLEKCSSKELDLIKKLIKTILPYL